MSISLLFFLLATATGLGATPAPDALTRREQELRATLAPEFTILIEPPFIVAGDEAPAVVKRRAIETVRWAVQRLRNSFFDKDPGDVITIYLFRDKESYERHAKALFGDEPSTPFGYYSARNKALVMNISTGGGTLVHEIVHPFIRANFPACPPWFNEGLGSLYEQSAEREGKIVGLTNWRLAGLQKEIREGTTRPLPELLRLDAKAFYGASAGGNYAQARYLCLYLQEQRKLEEFYRAFFEDAANDPSGLSTLKRVLKVEDLAPFQKTWEAWTLKLTFP